MTIIADFYDISTATGQLSRHSKGGEERHQVQLDGRTIYGTLDARDAAMFAGELVCRIRSARRASDGADE